MERVIKFIDNLNLNLTDYIIVGCSFGPDSMCLLNMLYEKGYKIVVAHINHNIRKESTSEYNSLKDFCKKNNIIFEGLELKPLKNKNESYYRRKRYTFFKELSKKYKAQAIFTAHHGDDLIETILMRISRGSLLPGYIGFRKDYYEYGIRIIKPLVYINKEKIMEYIKEKKLPYALDKTNDLDIYTRNRYRHNILPFLKKEQQDIHLKYLKYSEELEDACNFIDRCTQKEIKENFKNNIIDLTKFYLLDEFIKRKEIEYILKSIYGNDIDKIQKTHIDSILDIIDKKKNSKIDLPLDIEVSKAYDKLYFKSKKCIDSNYEYILGQSVTIPLGTIIKIDNIDDTSNYTIRLNSSEITLPLKIRTKKVGDKMEVKNMKGSKKIKDIFIDEKINPSIRNIYPILVDAKDTILWVPGLKKSKFDNEINEKYDIILKYVKKGDF